MSKCGESGFSCAGESFDDVIISDGLDAQSKRKAVAPKNERRVKGGGFSGQGRLSVHSEHVGGRKEYLQEHEAPQPHAGVEFDHDKCSIVESERGSQHQQIGCPVDSCGTAMSGAPSGPCLLELHQIIKASYQHLQTLAVSYFQPDQEFMSRAESSVEVGSTPLSKTSAVTRQCHGLSMLGEALTQTPQLAGCPSDSLGFPLHSDVGKTESRCLVEDFLMELPDKDLTFILSATPEVASPCVNPDVMSQLVSLYQNSQHGNISTADGVQNSISIAEARPLPSENLSVYLFNDDAGTGTLRKERKYQFVMHGAMKSVLRYILEIYGFVIQHTAWPCLQVMNLHNPKYLPLEVSKILQAIRHFKTLDEIQLTSVLNMTNQCPIYHEQDLVQTDQHISHNESPHSEKFQTATGTPSDSPRPRTFLEMRLHLRMGGWQYVPGPCSTGTQIEEKFTRHHEAPYSNYPIRKGPPKIAIRKVRRKV